LGEGLSEKYQVTRRGSACSQAEIEVYSWYLILRSCYFAPRRDQAFFAAARTSSMPPFI
jgi:hypothetical protein